MKFSSALKKVLSLLNKFKKKYDEKCSYALIGGLAVSAWGAIRATKDIDFLIFISTDIVEELKKIFENAGCRCELRRADFKDPVPLLLNVEIPLKNKEIEEISAQFIVATKDWEKDFLKAVKIIDMEGVSIPVLRAEELIVMKLKAGSVLDVFDAKNLLQLLKGTGRINLNKIKDLAKRVKADKKLSQILEDKV
jgi:predicted nucleotidyltransferase